MRKVVRGHKTEFKYGRGVQPTPKLDDRVEALTGIILLQESKLPKCERRSTERLFEELRGRGQVVNYSLFHLTNLCPELANPPTTPGDQAS